MCEGKQVLGGKTQIYYCTSAKQRHEADQIIEITLHVRTYF